MFDIRRPVPAGRKRGTSIAGIVITLSLLLTLPSYGQKRALKSVSEFIQGVTTSVLDNAALLKQNIPSTLRTGETYTVQIEMRNNGVRTWDKFDDDYYLALYDVADNSYASDVWGVRRVDLPYTVEPGEKVSFVFNIKAPYSAGTYNNRWSMKKGTQFFGEATPYWVTNVIDGEQPPMTSLYNNAAFVNQTVPSVMYPGSTYHVLITMKNTGQSTWLPNSSYKLSSVSGYSAGGSRAEWAVSPLYLTQHVEPGNTVTFELDVTAPSTTGTYNFQWQMMDGSMYFGEPTQNIPVAVTYSGISPPYYPPPTYPPYSSATFISQSVPSVMTPGRTYSVSVTMRNNGSATWYVGSHHLMFTDPRMNPTSGGNPWGISRVELPYTVYPGSEATFNFYVTAPSSSGSYWWQWTVIDGSHNSIGSTSSMMIDVGY